MTLAAAMARLEKATIRLRTLLADLPPERVAQLPLEMQQKVAEARAAAGLNEGRGLLYKVQDGTVRVWSDKRKP